MPIYIVKDIATPHGIGASADREMSEGLGVDSSVVINLIQFESDLNASLVTAINHPFSDSWQGGGTWTVEIEIDVGNADITLAVRCQRYLLKFGVESPILQSGAYTATQVMDVSRTFNPVAPIWTPGEEDCYNLLALDCRWSHDSSIDRSLTMGLGTAASEITTDVEENAGSCLRLSPIPAAHGANVRRLPDKVAGY